MADAPSTMMCLVKVEVKVQVYIHQPIKVIGHETKVEVDRKPCFTDCICTPQGRAAAMYSLRVYWLFSPYRPL